MGGMNEIRTTAVVLAAGQGKRMQSSVHKQYLLIGDKPVLYYSLKAFEDSIIDDIVLVVGKGEEEYCQGEILDKYGFRKIRAVICGGKELLHSGSGASIGNAAIFLSMMAHAPLLMMRSSIGLLRR